MDSIENLNKPVTDKPAVKKPTMKRRRFFFLFGASAVGLAMMSKSPLKLIGSIFNKSGQSAARQAGSKNKNAGITIRENPYAVKRGPKNG
jgi:hypothetical protein